MRHPIKRIERRSVLHGILCLVVLSQAADAGGPTGVSLRLGDEGGVSVDGGGRPSVEQEAKPLGAATVERSQHPQWVTDVESKTCKRILDGACRL